MYDVILQECVSKDVMCSYLMSLSDLDALDELQCLYLHKVKECDCLAQKLLKQTESVSKKFHNELLQRFAKVEKHSISLEIALQKYLKAQLQDKNIAISELKKLIEKGKGKSVDTKFDKPSVVRQPNAQRIPKSSVLGKLAPFSNSLERIYFPKIKSVPKTNVSEGLSKPVTAQTLPKTARQAVSKTNVLKPRMYRIDNRTAQTRAPQLPQTVRNTNPCVYTSTGVNHNTNVSRPHRKSNQSRDKAVLNNSEGIDVFIPNRLSKAGNSLLFSFHPGYKHGALNWPSSPAIPVRNPLPKSSNIHGSYVNVVKDIKKPISTSVPSNLPPYISSSPALVLDDSCVVSRKLHNYVMGEVKQFSSITNLCVLLSNEGFSNVKLAYLGGLWVMIELESIKSKANFMKHVGVASFFIRLCNAQLDFVSRERIVWVDIEGVPLHVWSRATFHKIGAKWGGEGKNGGSSKHVNSDDESDGEEVSDTYFGDSDAKPGNEHNQVHTLNDKETSPDPFNIYNLLKKQDDGLVNSGADMNISFPPCFTPKGNNNSFDKQEANGTTSIKSQWRSDGFCSRVVENAQDVYDCQPSDTEALRRKMKPGGSLLEVLDDMINVDHTMGSKAKKDWVRELNSKHKVSFLTLQETKMETISAVDVKILWGNYYFEYILTGALGNFGGILCVWDPNSFLKDQHIISDNFVALYGTWIPTKTKMLLILVYAPQAITDKRALWNYFSSLIAQWDGDCIVMRDFNEVRYVEERMGLVFQAQRASEFNNFIYNLGLVDVHLEGYSFTWSHPSASKMSKLDRFLVTEGVVSLFPHISAICLDRHLSDHRPILLRDAISDYGAISFSFYHSWLRLDGFDQMVTSTWSSFTLDGRNGMIHFKKKLQILKKEIRTWVADYKRRQSRRLTEIKSKMHDIDVLLDQGGVNDDILLARKDLLKQFHDFKSSEARDCIQKAKIEWAIKGDKNFKFFHGIINRKRANLSIKGIVVDAPAANRCRLDFRSPNRLSLEQASDLESPVTNDEIRCAVWGCGEDKSPGPDGFTFDFFRKFWSIIGPDFCLAVVWFFQHHSFSKGCNSSFVALIPKTNDPRFVCDYRPISLIGSLYNVVTKVLATRLSLVISDLISDVQIDFLPNRQILYRPFIINKLLSWCNHYKQQAMLFKVNFAKAYDSVRWDYLDDVLRFFGFGSKWCSWISGSLISGMAFILVNGSLTSEFQFHCGLKQGDPLAPYLFILIMESLHLSFSRVVDAGLFKGIRIGSSLMISHLFYADDAVFIGKWSDNNLTRIMHILHCFSLSSGLRINILKSHLLGVGVPHEIVNNAATNLGCSVMTTPFKKFFYGIHGEDKKITWVSWSKIRVENGFRSRFWKDRWIGDNHLCHLFQHVYALETNKDCSVAEKLNGSVLDSFRRNARGGVEEHQLAQPRLLIDPDIRRFMDEFFLPKVDVATRCINYFPIKINVFAWRVWLDRLPTRTNLLRRNVSVPSLLCPTSSPGDISHLLYKCSLAVDVSRLIYRWWDLSWSPLVSYSEWLDWFKSIRLNSKSKDVLECVFYVSWWSIWNYRNQLLFADQSPRKDVKDNKENDKIRTKPDKIKSKREAWKSPDSSPTKLKPSQNQENIKPRWENDPGKLGTAPDLIERRSKQRIVNSNLEEHYHPVVTMSDQRTMVQLLQTPTEGYEDAIVVPVIIADNFELKYGLLTLVQNKQFYRHDKEDPHAHIRYFNKITSTLKFPNIPNTSIKLMLLPFPSKFFPPFKTTILRNEITNFQQQFNESFSEAWDRFKDLLRACPRHGFSELHQLDMFYIALNSKDQDSLNFAAGGNFLDKMPRECLSIIESKSKVCYSRDKPVVAKVSTNAYSSSVSPDVVELKDMVKALLLDKKCQNQSPAPVKAVEESCVTCGGAHSYRNYLATDGNVYRDNIQEFTASTSSSGTLSSNTIANPQSDLKAITTRSGVSYDGPQIPPPVVKNEPEATKDTVNPTNNGNTEDVQPQAVQSKSPFSISEPAIALVSISKPNPKASIPYPSRRNDERNREN
uniref:RNA-directed DNA polymerase, eukaryota n=1 Tax=Tanacetum cinerariifolium TaxID=118510 RepID=A0A6L2JRK2_TANCI|nr:RNA-directed DNA polymerase, eukaryota [Tanacetum cinerariifolium]